MQQTFNFTQKCQRTGQSFSVGEQAMLCLNCGRVLRMQSYNSGKSCQCSRPTLVEAVAGVETETIRMEPNQSSSGVETSTGSDQLDFRNPISNIPPRNTQPPIVSQRNQNQEIGTSSPASSPGTPTNDNTGCLIGVGLIIMLISSFFVFPAFLTHANKAKQSEAKPNSSPKEEVRSQITSPTPSVSEERVNFDKGSTGATISNSVTTNQRKRYLLNCGRGERMTVQIRQGDINMAIISPNGQTIGNAVNGGTKWNGQLPSDGDYIIEVSAPNQSDYTINIEVLPSKNTPVSSTPATKTPVSSTPEQTLKNFYELTVKDNKAAGKKFTTDNFRNKYRSTGSDDQKIFVRLFDSIEIIDHPKPTKESSPTRPIMTVSLRYSPKNGRPQICGYRDFTFVLNNNSYLIDNDGEEIPISCP